MTRIRSRNKVVLLATDECGVVERGVEQRCAVLHIAVVDSSVGQCVGAGEFLTQAADFL